MFVWLFFFFLISLIPDGVELFVLYKLSLIDLLKDGVIVWIVNGVCSVIMFRGK